MSVVLTLIGPDDPVAIRRITDFAAGAGFIVADPPIAGTEPKVSLELLGRRILELITPEAGDEAILNTQNLHLVGDLLGLTAAAVWRRTGDYVTSPRGYRTPGTLFRRICDMMVANQLQFSNSDPALFNLKTGRAWTARYTVAARGWTRAATMLANNEVIHDGILRDLAQADIQLLGGVGYTSERALDELREQL